MQTDQAGLDVLASQCGPSGAYLQISDRELFDAFAPEVSGPVEARAAAVTGEFNRAWECWGEYWTTRPSPAYYVNADSYASEIHEHLPKLAEILVSQADRLWLHDFGHATYKPKREGRTFQWVDCVADSAYCGFFYMWFLRELGRAYLLTGDAKYPGIFRELICSWFDALPDVAINASFHGTEASSETGLAIIWNAGLGSSLRCVFMLDCYFLMRDSMELTSELHSKILKIFLGHSRYLFDTRMQEYNPSNFQSSITCWIISAAIMLPELKEAEQWLRIGVDRLCERIERNFDKDGAQIEQCPQYHLAGIRDIIRPLMLLQRNSKVEMLGGDMWERLERIFNYPIRIAHPAGSPALFNSGVYGTEWKTYLPLGTSLFDSPLQSWAANRFIGDEFIPVAKGISEFILFMDGDWVQSLSDARKTEPEPPTFLNELLEDSGLAVLRSGWDEDASSMVFDFNREPMGGHAYPGRLSFEIFANQVPLVIHPGSTISYSMPEYRNWCHQTISHNTVMVNNHSQGKPHFAQLEAWHTSDRMAFVSASTSTYKESDGVLHQRSILAIRGEYYFILDWLRGGSDATPIAWLLHSPQDIGARPDGSIASSDGKPGLLVVPDSLTLQNSQLQLGEGYSAVPVSYTAEYQPLDAWRDDVPYLSLDSQIEETAGGQTYGILIAPFASAAPEIEVTTDLGPDDNRLHSYRTIIRTKEHIDTVFINALDGRTSCEFQRASRADERLWSESTL